MPPVNRSHRGWTRFHRSDRLRPEKQYCHSTLLIGVLGSFVVEQIQRNGIGYSAATGEFGDLIAQGIVDPAKVTRSAVQNAASIAGMVLTTECLVTEKPEPKAAPAGGGGGGMGF